MSPLFSSSNKIPSNLEKKILVEQVRALYRSSATNIMASVAASFALSLAFWDVISHTVVISWFSLMLASQSARLALRLYYNKKFDPKNAKQFATYFTAGAALSGIIWGASGVVFFPQGETAFQLFLAATLFGMGTGSVITNSAYLPAVFAFFPTSIIPLSAALFYSPETIHISLGIMLVVALMALSYFAVVNNRGLIETLRLRFENVDLVKQLQEQKLEAEQANIAKSRFLAAASHDLRQPLHALTLFTSVLNESIQYPKVRKVVDQITASVDALQSLFNALLDISQLDAGVIQVEKTDFYLQPLLDKLSNDFGPLAKEKGLRIICPACPYAVHSDMAQLEQILRNYVSNAIRYTDSGDIKVTCKADGTNITIYVIDTGLGIAQEDQKIIFEEFQQLSNPERDRSKGLGLGLAIVQRTAKLLDHPINVESHSGKGSTFSVRVPQAHSIEDAKVGTTDFKQNTQPEENELIIVIDDEAQIREGMQSLLQQWGYVVICASDKEEALAQLEQQDHTPAGIVADYRLREHKTGIEVIQAICAKYEQKIPALIVTGDTSTNELREVNSSGFQVLHKPVAPLKLRAFLRHLQLQKNQSRINNTDPASQPL